MARGDQTLSDIEAAIRDLRERETALSAKLEADNQTRTQLLRERAKALRQLASVRTRSAVADGVIDEADRLDDDVARMLEVRQSRVDALKESEAAARARRAALDDESAANLARIEALEGELDQFAEQARQHLATDPGHTELADRCETLRARLERARAKTEQAEADRITKGNPYRDDPLFMYLWRRDYRGPSYAPWSIIRFLDGQVAAFIRYNEARANYRLLNEIPDRLAVHCERLESDLTEAEKLRDARLAETIAGLAGPQLSQDLQAARAQQKDLDARITAVEADLSAIANDLNRFAEGLDDAFQAAVRALSEFLEHRRYNDLVREARRTEAVDDDTIVARIGALNRNVEAVETRVHAQRKELESLGRRRDDLVKTAAEFRRRSYHQPGSLFDFDDDDIEDWLKLAARGALTVAEFWLRTQMRQRWSGRSADPFRRRSGFPPFDFGSGSGRRSKRRGRSRGGFRTGGGF